MRAKHIFFAAAIAVFTTRLASAQKLTNGQIEQSVGYVNGLQNPDGGFRLGTMDRESDLGATTVALRALKYLHPEARPRDRVGPKDFVLKCYDPAAGSFALKPGAKADVRSTAMGLMAMAELKIPTQEYADAINKYFADNAKTLGDIYIAAAALHPAGLSTPKAAGWIAAYETTHHADGSYGKDASDTAGAVNTILRLGGSLKDRDATARILRSAQQDDGGFAKPAEESELATTYREMRAMHMLKEKPDIARCRGFIARCRNDDGGYGVSPGQPSTTSGTYFAAIVLYWLDDLE